MIDYTLDVTDFLKVSKRYLGKDQQALLHTVGQISALLNEIFCSLPYSKTYKKFSEMYDDLWKEYVFKDDPGSEKGICPRLIKELIKGNGDKVTESKIKDITILTHNMIGKIKENPSKYRQDFRYARFLLNPKGEEDG